MNSYEHNVIEVLNSNKIIHFFKSMFENSLTAYEMNLNNIWWTKQLKKISKRNETIIVMLNDWIYDRKERNHDRYIS